MRVLVTGAGGMMGSALARAARERGWEVHAAARADLDIADAAAVGRAMEVARPTAVVNAAAYTAVDAAERDAAPATRVNEEGPAILARHCAERGAALLHISTDYVFDGRAQRPYRPTDATRPLSVYGRSKLAGEERVRAIAPRHLIVRTSWVLSSRDRSFVSLVIELARKPDPPRIVNDQIGSPTIVRDLVPSLLHALQQSCASDDRWGTYHFANAGQTTRYELACEILRLIGGELASRPIVPVSSAELDAPAKRPRYSVLDTTSFARAFGITPRPWREGLEETMREVGR
jgi:dTDP-4-dehydrorhamnose reductase